MKTRGILRGLTKGCSTCFFILFALVPAISATSQAAAENPQNAPDIESILKKLSAYCEKLETAALDFVCREDVRETIDTALDRKKGAVSWSFSVSGSNPRSVSPPPILDNHFVYDYQCVRDKRQRRETRTLIEENGVIKKVPDAKVKISSFVYGNILLSPVGMFAERFQDGFDFAFVGSETFDKKQAIVIEAKPKAGGTGEIRNFFGKAWIDAAKGDILKIEWSEDRIGNFEVFQERGKRYNRRPRITLRSEFREEKNGIRFPSRFIIEESYIDRAGNAAIRSKATVVYKDFKFFLVDVDVVY